MIKPFQTEIRVADLLALVNSQSVKYFICHNLAYMVRDKLAENEGFAEYMEVHTQKCNEGIRHMVNSGCYYYIYENSPVAEGFFEGFCSQVVGQLNAYIKKIFPEVVWEELSAVSTLQDTNLSDYVLELCLPNSGYLNGHLWYQEFNFKSRVALLELILEQDPEAVISINM